MFEGGNQHLVGTWQAIRGASLVSSCHGEFIVAVSVDEVDVVLEEALSLSRMYDALRLDRNADTKQPMVRPW